MELRNDGLTLWFDTPDAPMTARSITIGVRPAHPMNTVVIHYRSGAGFISSLRAAPLSALSGGPDQYFRASLPEAPPMSTLEVLPVLTCSGRQAPSAMEVGPTSSLWRRCPAEPAVARIASPRAEPTRAAPRFSYDLEFLGAVTIDLVKPPENVGTTVQGIRKNFFIAGGSCVGERLTAKIRPHGGDWLLIQKDGVALPDVRMTWETTDGAVLYCEYAGVCDLGPHGYENALQDRLPERAEVRFVPRFVTEHPAYAWINRLQCLGIGEVDSKTLILSFDLYAIVSGASHLQRGSP